LPTTLTSLPERLGQGSKILICDIPSNIPATSISRVFFHDAKCLRKINIPSTVTKIDGKSANDGAAFYQCQSLEEVTFGENSQLTEIGSLAFHKTAIKSVTIPDTVVTIGQHAFSYTKIVNSPFTEKSQLTTIGGRAFSNISTLKTFIVPSGIIKADILGSNDYGPLAESTIELVTFGNYCEITTLPSSFFGRAIIDTIILPEGPTNIPDRYFISATLKDVAFSDTIETAEERVFQSATVEVIRLGANFKCFINSVKDNLSFTNAAKEIKEIYIPASFYAVSPSEEYQVSYAFDCGSANNIKFFYTGTLEQLTTSIDNFKNFTISATDHNWKFLSATQISYTDYISNPDSYNDKNYIIYDYNYCQAFYQGNHENETTVVYEDFMLSGTKTTVCSNCKKTEYETTDPLFTTKGFSVPEKGGDGIAIGYTINKDAIDEYTNVTGKTLKYGVFATLYDKIANNEAVNQDGTSSDNVISVDVTKDGYVGVEFRMSGFITEDHKIIKLVMGMYLIETDEEETKINYLQVSKPSDTDKYSYIIYNDIEQ
ncbi:MAG: leucine-rich repeat domain-containing protein, partial [Clostridia bacterium]|nr:leucine-rich repeat domain-containing protein [Clostridia bacterium]